MTLWVAAQRAYRRDGSFNASSALVYAMTSDWASDWASARPNAWQQFDDDVALANQAGVNIGTI